MGSLSLPPTYPIQMNFCLLFVLFSICRSRGKIAASRCVTMACFQPRTTMRL